MPNLTKCQFRGLLDVVGKGRILTLKTSRLGPPIVTDSGTVVANEMYRICAVELWFPSPRTCK